jgi:hypothetical protein
MIGLSKTCVFSLFGYLARIWEQALARQAAGCKLYLFGVESRRPSRALIWLSILGYVTLIEIKKTSIMIIFILLESFVYISLLFTILNL